VENAVFVEVLYSRNKLQKYLTSPILRNFETTGLEVVKQVFALQVLENYIVVF